MARLRIIRSAAAEEDLIDIWLYVGQHNTRAADALIDGLNARMQMLADFPLAGPVRDDIEANLRQLIEGNYVILYRVLDDHVEITRILHARRQITLDMI